MLSAAVGALTVLIVVTLGLDCFLLDEYCVASGAMLAVFIARIGEAHTLHFKKRQFEAKVAGFRVVFNEIEAHRLSDTDKVELLKGNLIENKVSSDRSNGEAKVIYLSELKDFGFEVMWWF